jgi:hypothetical protein
VRSYVEIAAAIGEPAAVRAFGGGVSLKKRLPALEHGKRPAQDELL